MENYDVRSAAELYQNGFTFEELAIGFGVSQGEIKMEVQAYLAEWIEQKFFEGIVKKNEESN